MLLRPVSSMTVADPMKLSYIHVQPVFEISSRQLEIRTVQTDDAQLEVIYLEGSRAIAGQKAVVKCGGFRDGRVLPPFCEGLEGA